MINRNPCPWKTFNRSTWLYTLGGVFPAGIGTPQTPCPSYLPDVTSNSGLSAVMKFSCNFLLTSKLLMIFLRLGSSHLRSWSEANLNVQTGP